MKIADEAVVPSDEVYNPKVKENKLTIGEKFLISVGTLAFVMIMVLTHHPELYRGDRHEKLPQTNLLVGNFENNFIVGWAESTATREFSSLNLDRSIGTYNMDHLGLTLSSVGIGTYLGEGTDEVDTTIEAAIYDSVMKGINVIDTAINYRGMKSERCVGAALKRLLTSGMVMRDSLFISTKGGFIPADSDKGSNYLRTASEWAAAVSKYGEFPNDEIVDGKHCIAPACLNRSLELSRSNLGLNTIDLFYLHNAAEKQLGAVTDVVFKSRLKAAFTFLEGQRKLNTIRFYGMATWSCFTVDYASPGYLSLIDVIKIAESVGGPNHGFRYIQLPVTVTIPGATKKNTQLLDLKEMSFLESAAALNITVMSSRSIGGAKYQSLSSTVTVYQSCIAKNSEYALVLGEKMLSISASNGGRSKRSAKIGHLSQAATSLLVTRSIPRITTALVGMKESSHVSENVNILNLPLVPSDIVLNCILAKQIDLSHTSPVNIHTHKIDQIKYKTEDPLSAAVHHHHHHSKSSRHIDSQSEDLSSGKLLRGGKLIKKQKRSRKLPER